MSERVDRLSLNEATARELNEELGVLTVGERLDLSILCECGVATCRQVIHVPLADYERVRTEPTQFIVLPGHELPEIEVVVGRGDGYVVVRKREGTPAQIAREADARD